MTILQARKILGKQADNLSDEQVLLCIEVATMCKNIFFSPKIHRFIEESLVDSTKEGLEK